MMRGAACPPPFLGGCMREIIEAEIEEQFREMDRLKAKIMQIDAGIQALRWVLKKMEAQNG